MVAEGGLTSTIVKDLLIDISSVHVLYYSYFYLAVYYRNPKLLEKFDKPTMLTLAKKLGLVSLPLSNVILLGLFGGRLEPIYLILLSAMPLVASVAADISLIRNEKRHQHEDFAAKTFTNMALIALMFALVAIVLYWKQRDAIMRNHFEKFNSKNKQYQ